MPIHYLFYSFVFVCRMILPYVSNTEIMWEKLIARICTCLLHLKKCLAVMYANYKM